MKELILALSTTLLFALVSCSTGPELGEEEALEYEQEGAAAFTYSQEDCHSLIEDGYITEAEESFYDRCIELGVLDTDSW